MMSHLLINLKSVNLLIKRLNLALKLDFTSPDRMHVIGKNTQLNLKTGFRVDSGAVVQKLLSNTLCISELVQKPTKSCNQYMAWELVCRILFSSIYNPLQCFTKDSPAVLIYGTRQAYIASKRFTKRDSGTGDNCKWGSQPIYFCLQRLKLLLSQCRSSVSFLKYYSAVELPCAKADSQDRENGLGPCSTDSPKVFAAPVAALIQRGLKLNAHVGHVERRAEIHHDESLSFDGLMVGYALPGRKEAA